MIQMVFHPITVTRWMIGSFTTGTESLGRLKRFQQIAKLIEERPERR
jgi:hypothetical protein